MKGLVQWIWVDTFTKLPINKAEYNYKKVL